MKEGKEMKKAYSKPEIVFESFSLSVSIATCDNEAVHDGPKWTCKGYEDDQFGVILFLDLGSGCQTAVAEGEWNGLCYHTTTINLNLFGS